MEDAVPVHMVHGFDQLVHVTLEAVLRYVVTAAPDQLVDVHVHQLKHQREATGGLVTVVECVYKL